MSAPLVSVERLTNLLHGAEFSRTDQVLLCLAAFESAKKISAIKEIGLSAGLRAIKNWNVSALLSRAKGKCAHLPAGWQLTDAGRVYVRQLMASVKGGPSVVLVSKLNASLSKMPEGDTKAFVKEAIDAFECGLLRSAIVLSWVGAVAVLYSHVVNHHLVAFNAEALRRDSDWRVAKSSDDLALMKESTFLDILAALGILQKNVKEHLKNNGLLLRNSAGHPNSFSVGPAQVEAHIENLILNIFQKF